MTDTKTDDRWKWCPQADCADGHSCAGYFFGGFNGGCLVPESVCQGPNDGDAYLKKQREKLARTIAEYMTDTSLNQRVEEDDVAHIIELLTPVRTDDLVGVKEAAELLGVHKSNFIRDYALRKGFPKPVADLACGQIWTRGSIVTWMTTTGKL